MYSPQQLMQRPSGPAAFANIKSVRKDFCTVAVSIYLHTSLKNETRCKRPPLAGWINVTQAKRKPF